MSDRLSTFGALSQTPVAVPLQIQIYETQVKPPRRRARAAKRSRDFARRGVYVDYLNRWAWFEDSFGKKSPYRMIESPEESDAVQGDLLRELDASDPIPSADFVPAPISHLRLLT